MSVSQLLWLFGQLCHSVLCQYGWGSSTIQPLYYLAGIYVTGGGYKGLQRIKICLQNNTPSLSKMLTNKQGFIKIAGYILLKIYLYTYFLITNIEWRSKINIHFTIEWHKMKRPWIGPPFNPIVLWCFRGATNWALMMPGDTILRPPYTTELKSQLTGTGTKNCPYKG